MAKSSVEEHPEEVEDPVWHINKITVSGDIRGIIDSVRNSMKPGWYSLFWDENNVHVVFKDRVVNLRNEDPWQEHEFQELLEHAETHGISDTYFHKMRETMNNW